MPLHLPFALTRMTLSSFSREIQRQRPPSGGRLSFRSSLKQRKKRRQITAYGATYRSRSVSAMVFPDKLAAVQDLEREEAVHAGTDHQPGI
jgi:hypothetical protein